MDTARPGAHSLLVGLIACPIVLGAQGPDSRLSVGIAPSPVLIETRGSTQVLNCDLVVTNHSTDRLRIWEIQVDVFDSTSHLVLRKSINSNGFAPSIAIVAPRMLESHATIDIFNPFESFDAKIPLARLQYSIRYLIENNAADSTRNLDRLPFDADVEGRVDVFPKAYLDKTSLTLPLRGRVLVWDGHDFFSHHRRIPLHDPRVARAGIQANGNRYAIDLIAVDSAGRAYNGTPYNKENWFTYGMPIYAPGAGRVVASRNNVPDNWFEGAQLRAPDVPDSVLDRGNFVLIDHGDGEYSVFPHMKPGSVRVKAGEVIRQGQIIGQVGFTGDAIFPHVHYNLVHSAEGVPIYFHRFRRRLGASWKVEDNAVIDSGDIVESMDGTDR